MWLPTGSGGASGVVGGVTGGAAGDGVLTGTVGFDGSGVGPCGLGFLWTGFLWTGFLCLWAGLCLCAGLCLPLAGAWLFLGFLRRGNAIVQPGLWLLSAAPPARLNHLGIDGRHEPQDRGGQLARRA